MIAYQSLLIGRTEVAQDTMAFRFEKPRSFLFKPGQYIDLILLGSEPGHSNGLTHTFSIASSPSAEELVVATRMRDTVFKRALSVLPIGAEVRVDGPMGSFALHNNTARSAVLLAGGIGIAPFLKYSFSRCSGEAPPSCLSVLREPLPGRCLIHGCTLVPLAIFTFVLALLATHSFQKRLT
jgi:NAD(P)H-flavin reductase